jgi:LDH2 family malate/lactate/ureidoglycolate dehydrogenase
VTGTVTATVLNSNHLGALSYLARMATAQRMFVFACQNTRNNLVPWGGRRPVMGNNPMVWGLPLAGDEAMVLDMASSRTANGRLKLAKDRGESIELGWAVDPDGNPTADPALGLRGGLMPFGEHKGSGIAIFAGALSGVLSGANFGATLPAQDDYDNPVRSLGHFIYLVDVEALLPWEEYVSRMSRYLAEIKSAGSAVSLPGERSTANRAKAQAAGVPVERRLLRFMA